MSITKVSNNYTDNNPAIAVRDRTTGDGAKIQSVYIDIGDGSAESPVTAANPLPITGTITVDTTGLATSVKQDTGNASLASIDGKITAVNTGAVVVSSSALPTGAATEATLAALAAEDFATQTTLAAVNAKLVSGTDIGDVTINNAAGAAAVNIQDGGNSITIDGSVAANQSGTWNVTNVSGTVSLPTGAATAANQATIIGHVDGIETLIGTTNTNTAASTTALQIIDDWDESDRAKVNLIVGQAGVQGGSGVVSATTQRVVLATDVALPAGTNNIGDVDVLSSALPTGAATSANQTTIIGHVDGIEALLTTIDADTSVLQATGASSQVVQGAQAMNAAVTGNPHVIAGRTLLGAALAPFINDLGGSIGVLGVQLIDGSLNFVSFNSDGSQKTTGNVAHDAVDTFGPVKIGFKATGANALPAAVATGDRVDGYGDEYGRIQMRNNVGATSVSLDATASGNSTIVTPTSGKAIRVKFIHLVNNGSGVNKVGLRFAAAGTIRFTGDLPADGGTRLMNLINAYWEGATNEALIINLGGAGDVDVTVQYEEF